MYYAFIDFVLVMKQTLQNLFVNYGPVVDVVAHGNVRMRGQAFVSFEDSEIATTAQREVNRFPLYNKPMVMWITNIPNLANLLGSKSRSPKPDRMLL
jgi:RNA recognition motif-containing protein